MKACNICGKQWFNDIKFCPIDGVPLEDTSVSDPLAYLVGQVLNHTYKIESKIGEGSVGTVFRAKHLGIGDTVAIKVIISSKTEKSDSLLRFRREAKAARRLSHPNAVTVYDFNITDGGLLFMVMEYVDGVTVEKYLQENAPLRPQRALEILRPVATVLDVAHNLGIIHRDLKPANLMICKDTSGNEQIKVLDFGTARLVASEDTESAESVLTTLQGQVLGAPIYMSPEQALSESVTPATDIYTLGVVLYHMLAGTVPFNFPKSYQIMMAHINDTPDRPSERNPGLPVEFDEVILKAMAKKPEDRYKTATAMVDDLAQAISSLVTRDTLTLPIPSKKDLLDSVKEYDQTEKLKTTEMKLNLEEELRLDVDINSSLEIEPLDSSSDSSELYESIEPTMSDDIPVVSTKAEFHKYVGQKFELDKLKTEFTSAIENVAQPVFILGKPGTGKTILINSFQKWAKAQKAEVLIGNFTEFVSTSIEPLHVWKEMLGLIPIPELRTKENPKSENLSTAMLREQREERKWPLFDRLVRLTLEKASKSPLVIILEDLQWADILSLEFLGYFLRNNELRNFYFIGTVRSEEAKSTKHSFNQWLKAQERYFYYQQIELENFDQHTITLLLESIFQNVGIQQQDIEVLHEITDGNPLYLVQLLNILTKVDKISLHEGVWRVETLSLNKIPNTISKMVEQKLSLCSTELQDLLTISAAIEENIRFDLLEIITGQTSDSLYNTLLPALDLLLLKEEPVSQGQVLRFYHNLIRRTIYDNIPLEKTRKLHATIASAYNSLRNTKKFRVGAEFAYHNYLAGAWERAFQHGYSVAERAWQHLMLDEVIRFSRYAEDAASNLTELDKESYNKLAELKLLRLQTLLRLNFHTEVEQELEQMREFMEKVESDELSAIYHLVILIICNRNGHYNHGIEIGSAGLVLARSANDEETIRKLIYNIAGCHAHISKLEIAITLFENLYKMAKQANDHFLRSASLCSIGFLQHFCGNWRQARISLNRARQLAQEYNDPYRECLVLIFLAWIAEYEGNSLQLHAHYQHGLKISRTYGWANYEGYLHFIAGRHQTYSAEPDLALAQELLSNSMTIMQENRELTGQVIVAPSLALLNVLINPSQESLEHLRTTGESLAQWGEKLNYCEVLCFLAAKEQQNQQWESALATYQKALELAQSVPHIDCQWRIYFGLAQHYNHEGNIFQAGNYITQALTVIESLKKEFDSSEEIESFLENKKSVYELHNKLLG